MLGGLIGLGMLAVARGLAEHDEYDEFLTKLLSRKSKDFRRRHAEAVRMINASDSPQLSCEDRHEASLTAWQELRFLQARTKNPDLLANIDDMASDLWEASFDTFDKCCNKTAKR